MPSLNSYAFLAVSQFFYTFSSNASTTGFTNPVSVLSASNKTSCTTGTVYVNVTANNTKLLLPEPDDELMVTEIMIELLGANSTIFERISGGPNPIAATYGIHSKLCLPVNSNKSTHAQTVQILTHGDTLDSGYWDIASEYSYVDAAAAAGYASFSYDRIGVGKSDHPDPIQVVQGAIQVEILHSLIQQLRSGLIGGQAFSRVVSVGHSAGSTITVAVTSKYPTDLDAVILTGTAIPSVYSFAAVASFSVALANKEPSGRFTGLPNGYLIQATPQSIQFPYYRYPNFDPEIFYSQVTKKQPQTLGQLLSFQSIPSRALNFTGPVDIVLGENDYVFCGGNCKFPMDQSAAVVSAYYPAVPAGSQHYLVPGAGHVINAHYAAPEAFSQMTSFLQTNDIF